MLFESRCYLRSFLIYLEGRLHSQLLLLRFSFSISPRMPSSKRSQDARKRRQQKKKTKALEENAPRRPYLLPRPCVRVVHDLDLVAIDCEKLTVHSADPARKTVLASVGIVNRDGDCLYEAFVSPPTDRAINKKSRGFCPVTQQQFDIARGRVGTAFVDIRQEVLRILCRWV